MRDLIIEIDSSSSASPAILRWKLYTGCRMLVRLNLNNAILVDVSSLVMNLSRALCSIVMFLKTWLWKDVTIFTIIVSSLKSLLMWKSSNRVHAHGFMISLDIVDAKVCLRLLRDLRQILTLNYILPGKTYG